MTWLWRWLFRTAPQPVHWLRNPLYRDLGRVSAAWVMNHQRESR